MPVKNRIASGILFCVRPRRQVGAEAFVRHVAPVTAVAQSGNEASCLAVLGEEPTRGRERAGAKPCARRQGRCESEAEDERHGCIEVPEFGGVQPTDGLAETVRLIGRGDA